jgi:uncharacterized protein YjbJ (UPF0337 family)
MNWNVIETNWSQFTDHIKEQWSELGDSDMESIAGRRERLVDQLARTYGISTADAEEQVRSFEASNITFKGPIKVRTYARITSAEADYMMAATACGAKSGDAKDLCMRDAKERETRTIDDALANKNAVENRARMRSDSLEAGG